MKLFLAVMALASWGCDANAATQDGPAYLATVKIDDV
jgi:hypothetical protein